MRRGGRGEPLAGIEPGDDEDGDYNDYDDDYDDKMAEERQIWIMVRERER